jgi:hypothetical protein
MRTLTRLLLVLVALLSVSIPDLPKLPAGGPAPSPCEPVACYVR